MITDTEVILAFPLRECKYSFSRGLNFRFAPSYWSTLDGGASLSNWNGWLRTLNCLIIGSVASKPEDSGLNAPVGASSKPEWYTDSRGKKTCSSPLFLAVRGWPSGFPSCSTRPAWGPAVWIWILSPYFSRGAAIALAVFGTSGGWSVLTTRASLPFQPLRLRLPLGLPESRGGSMSSPCSSWTMSPIPDVMMVP